MFGLGMTELLVIFGIVLLLFGGRRLPEIASGLGGAINNFRRSLKEGADGDAAPADPKQLTGNKDEFQK